MSDYEKHLKKILVEALETNPPIGEGLFLEHLNDEMVSALVSGGLTGDEQADLQDHLDTCPACREKVDLCRHRMVTPSRSWRRPLAMAAAFLLLLGIGAVIAFHLRPGGETSDLDSMVALYRAKPVVGELAYAPGIFPVMPQGQVDSTSPTFTWLDSRLFADKSKLEDFFRRCAAGPDWPAGNKPTKPFYLSIQVVTSGEMILDNLPVRDFSHQLSGNLKRGKYRWWIGAENTPAPPSRTALFLVPAPGEIRELTAKLQTATNLADSFTLIRSLRTKQLGWHTCEAKLARQLWPRLAPMQQVPISDSITLAEAFLNDRAEFYRLLGVDPLAGWYRWLAREQKGN